MVVKKLKKVRMNKRYLLSFDEKGLHHRHPRRDT